MKPITAIWMYCIACLIVFIPTYIVYLVAKKKSPHIESHETLPETKQVIMVNGVITEE